MGERPSELVMGRRSENPSPVSALASLTVELKDRRNTRGDSLSPENISFLMGNRDLYIDLAVFGGYECRQFCT